MEGYWAPLTPPFEYDLSEPVVLRRTPTHARSGPIMRPLAPLLPSSSQAGRSDRRNVAEGLRTERSAPIPREDLVNLHPSTLSQLRLFPAVGERQSENPSAEHPAPSMGHSDARAETGQRRHHDLATVVPEHRILAPPTALLARAIIHNQQLGFSNMPLWNLGYIEGFLICQKEAVTRFLQERLFVLGLQNCSRIARVIINTMVPKKSSSNPYMGGEPTRPEWWPQDMSHLDPQRMRLPDTIILITHLIRLVARPRSEHHLDFWGLHLNIARLEDAVTRSLLDWLNDEDEREQQKRTILKEVFAVAGAEEEYLMGRLRDCTCILLSSDMTYRTCKRVKRINRDYTPAASPAVKVFSGETLLAKGGRTSPTDITDEAEAQLRKEFSSDPLIHVFASDPPSPSKRVRVPANSSQRWDWKFVTVDPNKPPPQNLGPVSKYLKDNFVEETTTASTSSPTRKRPRS